MGGSIKTDAQAKFIAGMADQFRDANIATFILYYDESQAGLQNERNQLLHLKAQPDDTLISKIDDSGFRRGSNLHSIFKQRGITNLLVSGFNAHACIKHTVLDALVGFKEIHPYKVALLEDMIGDSSLEAKYKKGPRGAERHFQEMEMHGALRTNSRIAMEKFGITP